MALVKRLLLALQLCTIVPVQVHGRVADDDLRHSVLFYPVVGALLGTALFGTLSALHAVLPAAPAAGVALALYTVLTGGLHTDGLMDVMDALGSRRPREQALEIMRDSRVGALGSMAGTLLFIGKFSALQALPVRAFYPFLLVPAASRLGMVFAMNLAPYARAGGTGLGAVFARQIPAAVVWGATAFAVLPGLVAAPPILALALPALAWLSAVAAAGFAQRRFGGMTGDLYGALNEVLEWVGWLVCLAFFHMGAM